jgi:hypothetical protein
MKHLTDEQLADWLSGEANQETQTHLESCTRCHSEAVTLRDGISRYSLAMREQSARAQSAHMVGNFVPRKALALHRLRWAGAGALALLLAAQTAWMISSRPPATASRPLTSAPPNSQSAAQMSDDELLEAVNNDLNREVPQALAPVSAITTARNKIAAASISAANNASGNKGESK